MPGILICLKLRENGLSLKVIKYERVVMRTIEGLQVEQENVGVRGGIQGGSLAIAQKVTRTTNLLGEVRMEGREWMNVLRESVNLQTDWKQGGKGTGSRLHFEPALINRDRDVGFSLERKCNEKGCTQHTIQMAPLLKVLLDFSH